MSKKKPKADLKPTIEDLEQDYWSEKPSYDSHLVTTIYKLRKKNLEEFTPEDFRIVIGQNFSLPILIPKAMDVLENDILAEGDFYLGDLLDNVLTITPNFWIDYPEQKAKPEKIFAKNQQRIKNASNLSEQLKEELFEKYNEFVNGAVKEQNVFSNYKPL